MKVDPVTLIGKYVRLEPMSFKHVRGLTEIGNSEDIWRYMLYGNVTDEERMRSWVADILSRRDAGTDQPFVVIQLASERVAGATRYMDIRSEHRALEIGGTWYGVDFQRTAVNTECKYLLLRHAFDVLGCIRVQIKTDLRNERSQRAIERIGAKREGVLRNHMILPDGTYRDSVYYSIIDSEWHGVKVNLERMLEI